MIMGMLGGIRMAALAAFETTAALKARGYPRFSMAGMTTLPMAAASATEEPEISLWIIVARIVTIESPPRVCSTPGVAGAADASAVPRWRHVGIPPSRAPPPGGAWPGPPG